VTNQCADCPNCEVLRAELAAKQQEIWDLTEALTRHDVLTGALNRRSLAEMITDELQRSSRTGQPFCLAVIGVDHLKDVNQAFGHDAGDAVLKTITREAVGLLRTLDRFGRIEGDVFGIVLPNTWLQKGTLALERLHALVAGYDWEPHTPGHKVNFSTGLTSNAPAENAEKMLKRALEGLAQAKKDGRNRIAIIEEPLPDSLFAAMDD
jgi:diguanylate cyclase (GGDEF)-like protein